MPGRYRVTADQAKLFIGSVDLTPSLLEFVQVTL